ncbi:hypothetical protein ACWDSF_03310 [Nocardia beijingensis]
MKPSQLHTTTAPDGRASAEWKLVGKTAHIVHLKGESGPVSFVPWPDLSEARERYPRLAALWDALRHDYWAEMLSLGMIPGEGEGR